MLLHVGLACCRPKLCRCFQGLMMMTEKLEHVKRIWCEEAWKIWAVKPGQGREYEAEMAREKERTQRNRAPSPPTPDVRNTGKGKAPERSPEKETKVETDEEYARRLARELNEDILIEARRQNSGST